MDEKRLTVPEVARMLQVSRATVYRYIERGQLRVIRMPSGRVQVDPQSVHAILRGGAP